MLCLCVEMLLFVFDVNVAIQSYNKVVYANLMVL